jgi:hypothetical protein
MDSFQAQDGSQRTALNLLQRKFRGASEIYRLSLTIRQATSRHSQDRVSRTAARPAVPRATLTLPASLSAALALLEERQHAGCKKLYDNINTGLDKFGVGELFGGHGWCRSSIVFCLYSYAFFCINIGHYRNEGSCDLASARPWLARGVGRILSCFLLTIE